MSNALKLVQIGRRELQLDDDMYRDLLQQITGKRSARELNVVQLNAVVAEMKRRGFKPKRTKPKARAAEVSKIRAIWYTMHEQGFINSRTDVAINTYVKRQTKTANGQGIDRIEWLNSEQAVIVLESLKKWHRRCMTDVIVKSGGSAGNCGYDELAQFYLQHYAGDLA